ncbi:MAG: 2,3,4,5-tetrahydropyridine-2,6-dicarboxylate N-succinyltransferase [bacterium]|nr:2,3,4,5-tetrahydropyridine-2,6-dicarboxylate N-succinyltransferase [Planctomycetota bacterium]HIL52876.1 2,3,4,5-tetrahydropyridine-2,6-dicarboxylate N-succinyltransferase [Planctomycetota bacterium]
MSGDSDLSGLALLEALESGDLRVANPTVDGEWVVNAWVKEAILDIFRSSPTVSMGNELERSDYLRLDLRRMPFRDKELLSVRRFTKREGVRLVPGGSAVRRGVFLGEGVVCMPPMYANIGAWVGPGSMIDSHALVGSCAQIGSGVHLSAGVQIGGVLEPSGARPVICEDGVFVGGQAGLFEGVLVGARAVIAAGVVLTAGTRLYDLVEQRELSGSPGEPLRVPPGAVVTSATRPLEGAWAKERGLSGRCAVIRKYRDAHTDAATALEDALR